MMTIRTLYMPVRRKDRWIRGTSKELLAARFTPEGRAFAAGQ